MQFYQKKTGSESHQMLTKKEVPNRARKKYLKKKAKQKIVYKNKMLFSINKHHKK